MPARSLPVSDCFGHAGSMIYQLANARPDGQTVLSVFFPAGTVFRRPIRGHYPLVLVSACALRWASTWLRRTLRVGVNSPFSTVHSSKLGVTLRTFA